MHAFRCSLGLTGWDRPKCYQSGMHSGPSSAGRSLHPGILPSAWTIPHGPQQAGSKPRSGPQTDVGMDLDHGLHPRLVPVQASGRYTWAVPDILDQAPASIPLGASKHCPSALTHNKHLSQIHTAGIYHGEAFTKAASVGNRKLGFTLGFPVGSTPAKQDSLLVHGIQARHLPCCCMRFVQQALHAHKLRVHFSNPLAGAGINSNNASKAASVPGRQHCCLQGSIGLLDSN